MALARSLAVLLVLASVALLVGCSVPTVPPEHPYDNPYDPYSDNFNDELVPGFWWEVYSTDLAIYLDRSAVLSDSACIILGGRLPGSEPWLPSNDVIKIDLPRSYDDTVSQSLEPLPPMTQPRVSSSAAVVDSNVYVFGGDTNGTAEVYLPAEGEWIGIGSLPDSDMAFGCFAASSGNTIIVGGGRGRALASSRRLYNFIPIENTWSRLPDMPEGLLFATAVVIFGKLYVIGGYDSLGAASARIHVLDLRTEAWTEFPVLLNTARARAVSLVWKYNIFVFGGETAPGVLSDAVDHVKVGHGRCIAKQPMFPPLYPYGCFVYCGEMLVIGRDGTGTTSLLQYVPY